MNNRTNTYFWDVTFKMRVCVFFSEINLVRREWVDCKTSESLPPNLPFFFYIPLFEYEHRSNPTSTINTILGDLKLGF